MKNKIKKIVEDLGLSFIYNAEEDINDLIDKTQLPVCVLMLARKGGLEQDSAGIRDKHEALLLFLDKTDFDVDTDENTEIIYTMRDYAFECLKKIQRGNDFRQVGDMSLRYFYDYFDVNVTGVGLSITLLELKGRCM